MSERAQHSEGRSAERQSHERGEATPTEATPTTEPTPFRQVITTAVNYRQTMVSLRHRLRPTSRSFSRFIHAPVVEKTSEVVGATVLRPSVSLGATTTAVLFTGFMYLFARHYGFLLRGSEIWLSLLAGGVIGLVIEAIAKLLRRRRV